MKNKNMFLVDDLIINVKKEECEELRKFTKEHGIIMKIGDLEEYPTIFPTKISIWYDKKRKIHIAALAGVMYKIYARNYVEIDFKEIKNYLKV